MITNFSNLLLIIVVNLYYYIGTLTLIILNSILFYDDKCMKYSHTKYSLYLKQLITYVTYVLMFSLLVPSN